MMINICLINININMMSTAEAKSMKQQSDKPRNQLLKQPGVGNDERESFKCFNAHNGTWTNLTQAV